MRHLIVVLFAVSAWGQTEWEFGGTIGYGFYHNGTIFSPAQNIEAGIRNRFAAGVILGQDSWDYISGEIQYLYHDGHPFLQGNGVKTDIQGQSHAFTFSMLFHLTDRDHRLRPFAEGGVGGKDYVIAGPPPTPQPVPQIATLSTADVWKPVFVVGGGVKFRLAKHVLVRGEFRDYITTFPKRQIVPAANNTARGIFQQFTPLFTLSYAF